MASLDLRAKGEAYRRDGVVRLPGVLSPQEMDLVEAAFNYRLENPSPQRQTLYPELGVPVINDRTWSGELPNLARALAETRIGAVVAELFGSGPVWFHEEQIWMKDARSGTKPGRRTPWHQDAAFEPFKGKKIAVVWMNLDPVPADCALEVVRGSFNGPLYNPPRFTGEDDTAGFFLDTDRPPMPDIQAEREKWDIVSWPAERGDMLVFHSASLHGGGATRAGMLRRSYTIRLVGDDVITAPVPESRPTGTALDDVRPFQPADRLPVGRPYYSAGLIKVHPGVDTPATV